MAHRHICFILIEPTLDKSIIDTLWFENIIIHAQTTYYLFQPHLNVRIHCLWSCKITNQQIPKIKFACQNGKSYNSEFV